MRLAVFLKGLEHPVYPKHLSSNLPASSHKNRSLHSYVFNILGITGYHSILCLLRFMAQHAWHHGFFNRLLVIYPLLLYFEDAPERLEE
jgi:hypothetical protein